MYEFDKRDSSLLRALAIVAIVMHNFFHAVSPAQQNEFTFNPARFGTMVHTVAQPQFAIQALFSFFGHFGVQVFIFASAYGLTKSHFDTDEGWWTFLSAAFARFIRRSGSLFCRGFWWFAFSMGPPWF